MTDLQAAAAAEPYPRAALAAPLRLVLATILVGALCVVVVDLLTGEFARAGIVILGTVATLVAWQVASLGRIEHAAVVLTYSLALMLTVRLWYGHGIRDFALVAFSGVLFLGSVFLQARVYWGLAACVVAGVVAVGLAEIAGALPNTVGSTLQPKSLVNLAIIMGASAVVGRVLMRAIRNAFLRERELSGALRSSEDRMEKIFRSSQNAIVVSRLEDGTYLEVNDAYLTMFGHSREAIIGHTSIELGVWEDPRERERFVRQIRESRGIKEFETRLRKKSGELIETQLSAELLQIGGEDCLIISTADVTAQRAAERRAEFLATRDALTGLPNRALTLDRLKRGIEQALRAGSAIAVLQIGLDRFKAVNESLGRGSGDDLLREACGRMEATLRPGDTLSRIGGDEFLYIADPMRHAEDAERVAARILAAFEQPFVADGRALRISCSIGVSIFPADAADAEQLVRYADTAMHFAKSEGRARFCLFDRVMSERVRDRLFVESNLRESIARQELGLVYQPKFDLATRAITGLEALARWTHPELGSVSPTRFIAIAEESDLILEIGQWVMRETCGQIALWRRVGMTGVPVAVNLSARQLNGALPAMVSDCIRGTGIEPAMVELEVTESMLISNPEATRRILQQLAAKGSRIVLDDFGVGYSSLGYVKHLPLDGLKIDRSFVSDIVDNRHDSAIVSAIVGLAHGLGLRVVAEGIEAEPQLDALRRIGSDEGQGFLLSRPLGAEEIGARFLSRAGI